MTSFTLNLISVKESFHDIFKKMLNITPVNITSFTVLRENPPEEVDDYDNYYEKIARNDVL